MKYQYLQNAAQNAADIVILPIAYEGSVSAKVGTKDAPKAILEASNQLEYYDEDMDYSPMKHLSVCVKKQIQNVANIDLKELNTGQLLITLGGDHSITPFVTQEVLKQGSTVVFLDAHADLRSSYEGDKYSHATPAFHLLKQGHKLVMAGVRSLFEKEAERIKVDKNITYFSDRSLQKKSKKEEFLNVLRSLEGDVYLSIDMDVFDPACVPSVGTPQQGGFGYYFATDILEALFFNKNIRVVGVDIVELIPELSTVSQTFAAKLLQKTISYWGKAQGFDTREMNGAQTKMEYE